MGILKKKTTVIPHRRQSPDGPVRLAASSDQRQNLFQRNRTLTGTTSNHVSASHNSTDLQSPRTHVHHLALRRRKIGSILLIVLATATVLVWLLTQLTARVVLGISDTTISRPIDTLIYQKAIDDYLSANPVSRLRFAMDQSSLSSYLSQALPEVAGVSQVSLAGIGETSFTLVMRKPVAGWKIDSKQYFVDAKGIAFERNYYIDPTVQIVDESGIALQQGTAIASNRFLGFVGRIVALSKEHGYVVTQAILPAGTTRQLAVRIQDVVPLVRLSIDRPAGEQVEDMSRALVYLASHGQSPAYIDVRVSGKAFYM
jgi:hypothetical protein